jgi:hypothetical protein
MRLVPIIFEVEAFPEPFTVAPFTNDIVTVPPASVVGCAPSS